MKIKPFLSIMILVFFLLCPSYVMSQTISFGPAAISTGGNEETPAMAVDAEGNVHLVWVSDVADYLFYKVLDKNGNVLVEETSLTPIDSPCDDHVRRPSIAIDSDGMLHIVFHGFSINTDFVATEYTDCHDFSDNFIKEPTAVSEVIYIKVNPNVAIHQTGTINDSLVVKEKVISMDDGIKSRAANIAYDGKNDQLHVVWFNGNSKGNLDLNYLVLDTDGNPAIAIATLTNALNVDIDWGEPEIAVGSDGYAHIVYCTDNDDGDTQREIYYTSAMANGAAATVIDDTMITNQDGHASIRPKISVDSENNVHVVWHDKRLYDDSGDHELFYSKLDPDPVGGTIEYLISEAMITANDGWKSYLKDIFVDSCGRVHIAWADWRDDMEYQEIYYQMFDTQNNAVNVLIPDTRITITGDTLDPADWNWSSNRNPAIRASGDTVYIAFHAEDDDGLYDIYLAMIGVKDCLRDRSSNSNRPKCFISTLFGN